MSTTRTKLSKPEREFVRRRHTLLFQLRQHLARYKYGEALPVTVSLAKALDLDAKEVAAALADLDTRGELVYRGSQRRGPSYRLRPGEQHPDDVAFDREIRQKIARKDYQQGNPLPTQILADRHGLVPSLIPRACRRLIKDGVIAYREGSLGPGLYVLKKARSAEVVRAP
ncbi:hypothetical protein [Streptomyces hydrogenans]|uniref:hypothetical protein n=1 Tax=Streptomyces hydrogenans TaxID=1873719 RepID=UPI0036E9D7BB